MFNALQIANFKAFADAQRIPLRPLTLIYGANSAGKSSVIHSLILAHHAIQTGELDVHRTTVGGESVDLGGFRQYVHHRDASRQVEWAVTLDSRNFTGRLAELCAPVKNITMRVYFGIALDDRDRPLPDARPGVYRYELVADEAPLLRMSRRRDGRLQLDRLEHEHPVFREVIRAMVMLSSTTEALQPEDFEGVEQAVAMLVPEVVASCTGFLPDGLPKFAAVEGMTQQGLFFTISKARRQEDLAAAVRSFLPRKIDELLKGLANHVAEEIGRLQYLGPLRSYPPRHLAFAQHHDPNWYAGGGYAWDVVRRDARVRELVNAWLGSADRLQTPYELVIRELVGLGDLETPLWDGLGKIAEESSSSSEESADELDSSSSSEDELESEENVQRLVSAVRDSDIEKLVELTLIDRRSNTIVSHRDVGIGISQVLPVLVSAYAAKKRMVAIEQPEIHLHPKLQAELGDVFISAALGGQENTFVLETHSEHLLLRVMKRMRQTMEGSLPKGAPPIRPEHVMVLYVEPDGKRSIVREMPLNERGELVKAWPGGFFEEGLREVF